MTERKFARGLLKANTAAELRQTVSQVVRETAVLVSIHPRKANLYLLPYKETKMRITRRLYRIGAKEALIHDLPRRSSSFTNSMLHVYVSSLSGPPIRRFRTGLVVSSSFVQIPH